MPRNFDELLSQDRTFIVRGETFTWRDVRPEVLTELSGIDEEDPKAAWEALDRQIMLFIVPEDHERWMRLRAREDEPITVRQLGAIFEYLVGEQTDRPTQTPSPSVPGPGKTVRSSKAESR